MPFPCVFVRTLLTDFFVNVRVFAAYVKISRKLKDISQPTKCRPGLVVLPLQIPYPRYLIGSHLFNIFSIYGYTLAQE